MAPEIASDEKRGLIDQGWVRNLIFSLISGLVTYAFTVGGKAEQFSAMQKEVSQIEEHLRVDDKIISDLEGDSKLYKSQIDRQDRAIDRIEEDRHREK